MEKDENSLCRKCKFFVEKENGDSIFPINYCSKKCEELDSLYMNKVRKECFKRKVTGPWRMPEGGYTEDEFRTRIICKIDEYTEDESLFNI